MQNVDLVQDPDWNKAIVKNKTIIYQVIMEI